MQVTKMIEEYTPLPHLLIVTITRYLDETFPLSAEEKAIVKMIEEVTPLSGCLVSDIIRSYWGEKYPGRHKFRVNEATFDIDRKYFPLKVLDKGSLYTTCLVQDRTEEEKKAKKTYAIKKYTQLLANPIESKRVLLELKLLQFCHHPNILSLKDVVQPRFLGKIEDLYLVTESIGSNLKKLIQSSHKKLSNQHIQYLIYQLLNGLKYLHSLGLVYRDLKPEYLLVDSNCRLKIGHLSSLRPRGEQKEVDLEKFDLARHYRAPELLAGTTRTYNIANDVWSVGCIIGEMIGKKVLFPTGRTKRTNDSRQQFRFIIETLGTPSNQDLDKIFSYTLNPTRTYIQQLPRFTRKSWSELFPEASPLLCDLLDKCLQINPQKRITIDQALKHEYFASLNRRSETKTSKSEKVFDWKCLEFRDEQHWEKLIWEEIYHFRPYLKERKEQQDRGKLAIKEYQQL